MTLQQQPPPQLKINLDDLEPLECEDCKGVLFDIVWRIHKVPAMLSRTGKESMFPVSFFRCVDCHKLTKVIHSK